MRSLIFLLIIFISFYGCARREGIAPKELLYESEGISPKQIQVQALLIEATDYELNELGILANLKKMPDRDEVFRAPDRRCYEGGKPPISLLDYPTINVLDGVKGGSIITLPIQYMEKLENGNFVLKTCELQKGFEVKATIKKDEYIIIDVDFKVSKVLKRIRIEGVELNVGCPIIRSDGIKTTVKLKNGEVLLLGNTKKRDGPTINSYYRTVILLTAHML